MIITLQEGLARLDADLERLRGNPQRLEHERSRFNKTPEGTPPQSGATTVLTRSPPPELEGEEGEWDPPNFSWAAAVNTNRKASRPNRMIKMLAEIERERFISLARIYEGPAESAPPDDPFEIAAIIRLKIRQRWIDQGIWHSSWVLDERRHSVGEAWRHETAFKGDRIDDPENKKSSMQRAIERDASRPSNQFLYEVRREQEWYEECRKAGADNVPTTESEIESRSYDTVVQRWKHYHIWDPRWGRLPGVKWRHEMPLLEVMRQKLEDNPALDSMPDERRKSVDSYRGEPQSEIVFKPERAKKSKEPTPRRPCPVPRRPQTPPPKKSLYTKYKEFRSNLPTKFGFYNTRKISDEPRVPIWRLSLRGYELCFNRTEFYD
ncbi:unnamed protein product [Clonostachys rhizophaga]|uniref:Uncharacterized protein n=1 Tax=Clonostachys rhizophaga TaxID=160324 RepID=A0A9N9VQI3_9HYPO|nr:unnamed protein product [Clonostachys rhizophaga]